MSLRLADLLPSWLPSTTAMKGSWTSIMYTTLGATAIILLGMYIYFVPYTEHRSRISHLRGRSMADRTRPTSKPVPTVRFSIDRMLMPGPPREHWFWGVLQPIIKAPPMVQHAEWAKTYGPTYRYSVLFNFQRFYTEDTTALSYILQHSEIFQKPSQTRRGLSDMLGNGLLTAEGPDHKRQRKLLNSSFSPGAVRGMVPIFFDKGYELRDKLLSMIEDDSAGNASPTPPKPEDRVEGGRKIDVMKFLGQATLDVIGLAGFNYDFHALSQPKNELAEAYREMFSAGMNITFMAIVQALVPGARYIVRRLPPSSRSYSLTIPADKARESHKQS